MVPIEADTNTKKQLQRDGAVRCGRREPRAICSCGSADLGRFAACGPFGALTRGGPPQEPGQGCVGSALSSFHEKRAGPLVAPLGAAKDERAKLLLSCGRDGDDRINSRCVGVVASAAVVSFVGELPEAATVVHARRSCGASVGFVHTIPLSLETERRVWAADCPSVPSQRFKGRGRRSASVRRPYRVAH